MMYASNPFVEDPSTAHARFPDLTASNVAYQPEQQQHQQQYRSSYVSGGPQQVTITPQGQSTPTFYAPQYPPQGQLALGPQPTGVGPFHAAPTAGFVQQYHTPLGYPYSGASYPPQATTAVTSYLAEFDPYAHTQSQFSSTPSPEPSAPGASHPRDLIRTHKAGLEAWDTYSWKQLFGACDALKEAWSARKRQAEGVVQTCGSHADPGLFGPDPTYGYQVAGWRQVLKDASDNFDIVAASTFQLHEVFHSYRQSGDQASKQRVRESCNAAVKGLPDWPSN